MRRHLCICFQLLEIVLRVLVLRPALRQVSHFIIRYELVKDALCVVFVARLDYIENGEVTSTLYNNSRDARVAPVDPKIVITSFSILTCIEVDQVCCQQLLSLVTIFVLSIGYDSEHDVEVDEH